MFRFKYLLPDCHVRLALLLCLIVLTFCLAGILAIFSCALILLLVESCTGSGSHMLFMEMSILYTRSASTNYTMASQLLKVCLPSIFQKFVN